MAFKLQIETKHPPLPKGEGVRPIQKVISMAQFTPGQNDLETVHPELAAEWHPTRNGAIMPSQVLPGYDTRVWWTCAEGHEWEAVVSKRNAGRGCPICARRRKRK